MTAVIATPPFLAFYDDDGNPLSGGLIYTYAAGTTTPKATYTDSTGLIPMPNPIVLDSAGRATWWLIGSYKYVIKDASGTTIKTTDNVTSFTTLAVQNSAFFQSFSGNGSQTAFTLSSDLGTEEKGLMIFIDSGLQQVVSNGTFDSDTAWTKGAGWTIGSGVATATGAISTSLSQAATVTLTEGKAYSVTYTVTRTAGSISPTIGGRSGVDRSAAGTYSEVIIAGSNQEIAFQGSGFTGTLDNVKISTADGSGFDIVNPSAFTLNGTALTFATAPALGTSNIYIFAPSLLLGAASSAAAAAEASATAALSSEAAAAASEAAALASEGAAASSASTATTQAGIATTQAGNAASSASTATTQAGIATTQAGNASTSASASAASAVAAASTFIATSTTSNSISVATGKSFTTQANKNFQANQFMLISDASNAANFMFGQVTSYNNGTGALVFDSQVIGGSGTLTNWNISISGIRGANGAGTGDFSSNTATSVDSEIVVFSGTGGKTGKRATGTGFVKVTSGVMQTPVATVPLTDLATQAANTFLANASGSTAAPTAVALAASQLAGRGASGNIAPITLGTGLSMSGATLNASGGGTNPKFFVRKTSNQSIGVSTLALVTWETAVYDTNSNFNLSTERFLPTVEGYYSFFFQLFSQNSTDNISMGAQIFKNGSRAAYNQRFMAGPTGGGIFSVISTSVELYMNGTTDYVEAYATFGTVANEIRAEDTGTFFMGHKLP